MVLVKEFAEVVEKSVEERALSAAGDHTDGHATLAYLPHERFHPIEDAGIGHLMEQVCLHVVHLLCLLERDVVSLLCLHHHADGVDATSTLGGIGIVGSHGNVKLRHGLLPGTCVVRHGIIENAIHVEKHSFGLESLKAVL